MAGKCREIRKKRHLGFLWHPGALEHPGPRGSGDGSWHPGPHPLKKSPPPGSAGTLSGTYARNGTTAAAAVRTIELVGAYDVTFDDRGYIHVSFNGEAVDLSNGTVTASGHGTYQFLSGEADAGYQMNAQEQAVYNSLIGTWRRDGDPGNTSVTHRWLEGLIINADGSGIHKTWFENNAGEVVPYSEWTDEEKERWGGSAEFTKSFVELGEGNGNICLCDNDNNMLGRITCLDSDGDGVPDVPSDGYHQNENGQTVPTLFERASSLPETPRYR